MPEAIRSATFSYWPHCVLGCPARGGAPSAHSAGHASLVAAAGATGAGAAGAAAGAGEAGAFSAVEAQPRSAIVQASWALIRSFYASGLVLGQAVANLHEATGPATVALEREAVLALPARKQPDALAQHDRDHGHRDVIDEA